MARKQGNLNRRDYMALVERVFDYMLERGPIVDCDEYQECYWCKMQYSWIKEDGYDHETYCLWLAVQETIGEK